MRFRYRSLDRRIKTKDGGLLVAKVQIGPTEAFDLDFRECGFWIIDDDDARRLTVGGGDITSGFAVLAYGGKNGYSVWEISGTFIGK